MYTKSVYGDIGTLDELKAFCVEVTRQELLAQPRPC